MKYSLSYPSLCETEQSHPNVIVFDDWLTATETTIASELPAPGLAVAQLGHG